MNYTLLNKYMDDKKITLNPVFVAKDVFVKIIFVNQQLIKQKDQQEHLRVHQIIERMKKSYRGGFEVELSLKNIICQIIATNNIQIINNREDDFERNLYDHIIKQISTLTFVYEVDQKLRIDQNEVIVKAQEAIGSVAAQALGSFKNVNQINIEDEIKVMLKPLSDLLEKKKRNKVFKLKPAKQMTKCNEYDFNIKPQNFQVLKSSSASELTANTLSDEYLSDSTTDNTSQKSDQLSIEIDTNSNHDSFEKQQFSVTEIPSQVPTSNNIWQKKRQNFVMKALSMQNKVDKQNSNSVILKETFYLHHQKVEILHQSQGLAKITVDTKSKPKKLQNDIFEECDDFRFICCGSSICICGKFDFRTTNTTKNTKDNNDSSYDCYYNENSNNENQKPQQKKRVSFQVDCDVPLVPAIKPAHPQMSEHVSKKQLISNHQNQWVQSRQSSSLICY